MFQNLDGEGFVFLTHQFWLNCIRNHLVAIMRSRWWCSRSSLKKYREEKFLVKKLIKKRRYSYFRKRC